MKENKLFEEGSRNHNWLFFKNCYHRLPHASTWCDGIAFMKRAWWFKVRILGLQYFFLLENFCVQISFWSSKSNFFLVFNTPGSRFFCLQYFGIKFTGRLFSNLYCEKVFKFFSKTFFYSSNMMFRCCSWRICLNVTMFWAGLW